MNEEHFLTELKIYLRALSTNQLNKILQTYQQIFSEQKTLGMNEEEISKMLGKPREIAQQILSEFDLSIEDYQPASHSWQEFQPYTQSEVDFQHATFQEARTSKWLKRIGLIAFNLFIMLWLWLTAALSLLVGWGLTVICFVLFGAGILSISHNPDIVGLFPFSIGLVFLGLALIGLLLMPVLTLYFFRFTRDYIHWHLKYFRKGGASS